MLEPVPEALMRNPTPQHDVVVQVSDCHLTFGDVEVLRGVSLEVRRGETLAIIGGSGSGKSTLLRAMIGALRPTSGSVRLFRQDVYAADDDDLASVRRRLGVLFQSGALFSSMTVGENIALLLREHQQLDEELVQIIVKMKLELVGLRDFEGFMPAELSGGMQKRVALARALALDPEIIFYDEPSSGLDPVVGGVIDKLIVDLSESLHATSIVVTHHMGSAFRIADRMIMLYGGEIIAVGSPQEFRDSTDPLVRQFVDGSPDGPIPLRRSRVGFKEDLLA